MMLSIDVNSTIALTLTFIVDDLLKKYYGTRKYATLFIILGAIIAGIIASISMHYIFQLDTINL